MSVQSLSRLVGAILLGCRCNPTSLVGAMPLTLAGASFDGRRCLPRLAPSGAPTMLRASGVARRAMRLRKIAPTVRSGIAPTGEARIAPTVRKSGLAPTERSPDCARHAQAGIAPTKRSGDCTGEAGLHRQSEAGIARRSPGLHANRIASEAGLHRRAKRDCTDSEARIAPTSASGDCTDKAKRGLHRRSAGLQRSPDSCKARIAHAQAGIAPTKRSGIAPTRSRDCTDKAKPGLHRRAKRGLHRQSEARIAPSEAGIAPTKRSGDCTAKRGLHRRSEAGIAPRSRIAPTTEGELHRRPK